MKSGHATCISRSAQVGGHDLASSTVIFNQGILIFLVLVLRRSAISQLGSFLHSSFFNRLIVIHATLSQLAHHPSQLLAKAVPQPITVV